MEIISKKTQLRLKDLLCPQLYVQLAAKWPATSCSSFEDVADNLLLPTLIITLRVNTLRCTDTSAALADAERCLGLKGYIHPKFRELLTFPREFHFPNVKRATCHKSCVSDCLQSLSLQQAEGASIPQALRGDTLNPRAAFKETERCSVGGSLPAVIVVSPQCGQAVLRGSHVFACGVLAAERGIKNGDLVSVWTVPRPFRCTDTSGGVSFGASACMRSLTFLRGAYLDKESKEALLMFGLPCGTGCLVQPLKNVFLNSKGVAICMQGASDLSAIPPSLVAQQLPSALASLVLKPQPGERVLDMCAAPGHKTSHLAALMCNKGVLVAIERSRKRVEDMQILMQKLGATVVECVHADSTKDKWHCSLGNAENLKGAFDRVLADVPCTGLGLRPRLVYDDVDIHSVAEAAKYQKVFITKGCELLKPGGVLVYSTCSISWEENEGAIHWALDNLPLQLEPAEPFYSPPRSGVRTPEKAAGLMQRFCPAGETIGFFIAKLRKKEEDALREL